MARNYLATLLGLLVVQPVVAAEPKVAASPAVEAPSVALMGPGLRVSDLDASERFYEDGLGLMAVTTVPLGDLKEIILGFGSAQTPPFLFLIGPKNRSAKAPAEPPEKQDKIVLVVADARSMQERLAAAGYTPGEIGTHEPSGTLVFWVTDPDGNRLEITQLPAQSAGASGANGDDHD